MKDYEELKFVLGFIFKSDSIIMPKVLGIVGRNIMASIVLTLKK